MRLISLEILVQLFRTLADRRSCFRIIIGDNATKFLEAAPFIIDVLNGPKVQQAVIASLDVNNRLTNLAGTACMTQSVYFHSYLPASEDTF